MKPIENLPRAFSRYQQIGGVLEFTSFEYENEEEGGILAVIPQALVGSSVDAEKLRSLGCKRIDERTFFGDWFDVESGMLLKIGSYTADDGSQFENPTLADLEGVRIVSGAGSLPEAGAGGQFAYAFTETPYPLRARPCEVQTLFDEIVEFVLSPPHQAEIYDWTSPRLPEVSDYFVAGMEWWGVFLFSVYVPNLSRLTIIAGSTTD